MTQFASGVRFAQVAALPAAAANAGIVLEQGGRLWFSDGATWADLGATGGGGAVDWTLVTAGQTLADDTPLLAVITANATFPIPASPVVGDEYVVRNASTSTAGAQVIVDPGAGRAITYGAGMSLAAAETLTCERGETIHLIVRTPTAFELQTPGAVGPVGPAGAGAAVTSSVTPAALAAAAAIGASAEAARADHAHARPTPAEIGAAAASHTQPASTISDFNSASRSQTEAALVAGANVTITPAGSGATRTLTIASTGGGGGVVIGTAVADFGPAPGKSALRIAVSNAAVTANSRIAAWLHGATATHNEEEHAFLPIRIGASNRVAGVGFTLHLSGDLRLTGTFNVIYSITG